MALHDLYAAIWDRSSGPAWQARHRMSAAEYQQTFDQMLAQGYRLRMVSGYAPEGHDLYAALWEHAGGPAWQARHRMSAADYQHTFDQMLAQGFRLVTVSGYTVGGQDLYAALWEKDSSVAWQARHRLTANQYQTTFDQLVAQGYRLTWVDCYTLGGEDRYAAIWHKSSGPAWQARHRMTPAHVPGDVRPDAAPGLSAGLRQRLQHRRPGPVCRTVGEAGGSRLGRASRDEFRRLPVQLRRAAGAGLSPALRDGLSGADPALAAIKFTMQHQLQSEWCWAAVSVSVAHYYDSHSSWTQCQMVNAQRGLTSCCQNGGSNDCNQPGFLDDALTRAGHLQSETGGTTAIGNVVEDLTAGNPVCIRIGWSGGGGHFIAATGAEDPDTMIVTIRSMAIQC